MSRKYYYNYCMQLSILLNDLPLYCIPLSFYRAVGQVWMLLYMVLHIKFMLASCTLEPCPPAN